MLLVKAASKKAYDARFNGARGIKPLLPGTAPDFYGRFSGFREMFKKESN